MIKTESYYINYHTTTLDTVKDNRYEKSIRVKQTVEQKSLVVKVTMGTELIHVDGTVSCCYMTTIDMLKTSKQELKLSRDHEITEQILTVY